MKGINEITETIENEVFKNRLHLNFDHTIFINCTFENIPILVLTCCHIEKCKFIGTRVVTLAVRFLGKSTIDGKEVNKDSVFKYTGDKQIFILDNN